MIVVVEEIRKESPSRNEVLWELTRGHRRVIAALAALTFVGALVEAGFLVLLTGVLLGLAGGEDALGPFMGIQLSTTTALVVATSAIVVRLGLNLLSVRLSAVLTSQVTLARRRRLAAAYLRADWATQQREPSGRLQELLTSFVSRVTTAVLAITQAITAALSLLAFVGTGVLVEPLATGIMLVALFILGLVLTPVRRRIRRRAGTWSHMNLAFANRVSELSALGQEMQTFGVVDQFTNEVEDLAQENAREQRIVQALNGSLTPLYTFLAYAAILGGLFALNGMALGSVASIGAVMLLLLRSLSYGQQLLTVAGQLATSVPFLHVINATIANFDSVAAPSGDQAPHSLTPLELHNASVSYDGDRTLALANVSLRLDAGEMVGVIGPSGSGKSTLAQLLLGLREPSTGSIRAAGQDLATIDRKWWTSRVAIVPQEARLVTGTVADNIRFFRSGISDVAVARALRQANLFTDVEALPHGINTHLGERGGSLSGGQRQRLVIARALVGHPGFLVLDEPTSALDGHSELLIRETLDALRGSVTMVVIAHRMSTLELCDRIIVVEGGRITADDTPSDLRERSEFYRRALAIAGIA